ncbi:MAG: T9SS type A sorting domain-containing protein [Owenweeksia sp.]
MKKFLFLLCFTPLCTYSQTQFAKVALHLGCDSIDFVTVKTISLPNNKNAILANIIEVQPFPEWRQPALIIADKFGNILSTTRLENGIEGGDIIYFQNEIFIAGVVEYGTDDYVSYLASLDLNGNLNWQKKYSEENSYGGLNRVRIQIIDETIYLSHPYSGGHFGFPPNGYSGLPYHLLYQFDMGGNFLQSKYLGTAPIDYGQFGYFDEMWDSDYSYESEFFAAVGVTSLSYSLFSSIHLYDANLSNLGFYIDSTPSDIVYKANYFDSSSGDLIMAGQNSTVGRLTRLNNGLSNIWAIDLTVDNKVLNIYDVLPGKDGDIILVGTINGAGNTYRTCILVFSSSGSLLRAFYHTNLELTFQFPYHNHTLTGSTKEYHYSESTGLIGTEDVFVNKGNYAHYMPEIFAVNPYNPDLCIFSEPTVQISPTTTDFEIISSGEFSLEFEEASLSTAIPLDLFPTNVCIEGDTAFYYIDTTSSGSRIAATTDNANGSENLQKQENQTSLLYPNPNSNEFSLNLSAYQKSSEVSIRILSLDGKIMMEKKLEGGLQQSLVAHRLKPGIYLVQLNGQTKEKLVVQ